MSINKVFKQSSTYLWGEALIMASGFISFPILTRIFTKHQYGLLSLLGATVAILSSLATFGANRSMVRFYHKYKMIVRLNHFLNTIYISMICIGTLSVLLVMAISCLLNSVGIISRELVSLLPLALCCGIFQNLFLTLNTINRMEERISVYNLWGIISKYVTMFAAIILVLIYHSLFAFYSAQIVAWILLISLLAFWTTKNTGNFLKFRPSKSIFKETVHYGLPLSISTIAYAIYDIGDRYIIAYLLDTAHVASYSVAYTICTYFNILITTPLSLSITPLTFKLWAQGEKEETRKLLTIVVKFFYLLAMPAIFLSFLVPKELIAVLASSKYLESAEIMPIIMCGVMIGFGFPFAAGLHLEKKTTNILIITLSSAALNIILNFFLIPIYGLKGAAYATIISHVFLIGSMYMMSRRFLKFRIPYGDIIKYLLLSIVSFICSFYCSKLFLSSNNIVSLLFKSITFSAVYGLLLFIFDSQLHNFIISSASKIFSGGVWQKNV